MRHFPNLIDAYLSYTEGQESTVRIRKWCIISVIAAAMERKAWIDRGHIKLFPNLYVFIIGKSGIVKKSTSTQIAVNLLRQVPKIRMMSERLTAGSLIRQFEKSGKTYEYEGEKIGQSALFSYAPELAVFLSEVFGSIIELLTTFYDCQSDPKDGPWVHNTVGGGEVRINGPCLNILGASTPAWLKKCIPRSEMEGGFTSRVVFVVENNLPDKLIAWPEVSLNSNETRDFLVEDLCKINKTIGKFHVEQEPREAFEAWYNHHISEVVAHNKDGRMTGYLARKGDLILKLCMIKSIARSSDLIIRAEDLEWASYEINDLEPDWVSAFDSEVNPNS